MANVIFFDTETTGVPKNYKGKVKDLDNWPRIIQFGWQVADLETEEILRTETRLIKPNGWEVPSVEMFMRQGMDKVNATKQANFWLKNGFTQQQNAEKGEPMEDVLDFFINDIEGAEIVGAHNMAFDMPITGAEMLRYGKSSENRPLKFCTMLASTNIVRVPHTNGRGFKWPTLAELYMFLFQKTFDGAHDAGNDVSACRECFFELRRRGLIDLP